MFLRLEAQSCKAKTAAGLIQYSLLRSPRRKTLTIYVQENKRVRVLAPLFLSDRDIASAIEKKAFWIIKTAEKLNARLAQQERHCCRDGENFLFLGEHYPLCYVPAEGKRIKIDLNNFRLEAFVPCHMPYDQIEVKLKKTLLAWYKAQAKNILEQRLFSWRQKLNIDVHKVVVRSQKRIWGSSYHRMRRINLNWKIVMMPFHVIDYVIVHELCHFYVPNHSKQFWNKVKDVFPGYQESEQWLKEHEALIRLF